MDLAAEPDRVVKMAARRLGVVAAFTLALSLIGMPVAVAPASAQEGEPTVLTVAWPKGPVAKHKAAIVTGTLAPATDYGSVELELLDGKRWVSVDYNQVGRDGTWRLRIPTTDDYIGTFRVLGSLGWEYDDVYSETRRIYVGSAKPDPFEEVDPGPNPTQDRRVKVAVSKTRTTLGGKVTLTGTVTGGPATQRVTLMQRLADGWHGVKAATAQRGKFAFAVPTNWLNTHRLAVRADAYPGAASAMSPTVTVAVVPSYQPKGKASSRAYLDSLRYRFNPCQVIEYRVNPARMPQGAMSDVKGALARISAASGLTFRHVGSTKFVFNQARRPGPRNPGTDLFISWATPAQVPGLYGNTAGLGGPSTAFPAEDAKGRVWVPTYGNVVLDATESLPRGFGADQTLGELLLHEIMHALGVGHVNDPTQVMNPMMTDAPAMLGAGDLAVLRDLGMAGGCITQEPHISWRLAGRRETPRTEIQH